MNISMLWVSETFAVKQPDHIISYDTLPAPQCLGLQIRLWPKMLPNASKKLLAANALFLSTSPNIKPSYDYQILWIKQNHGSREMKLEKTRSHRSTLPWVTFGQPCRRHSYQDREAPHGAATAMKCWCTALLTQLTTGLKLYLAHKDLLGWHTETDCDPA